MNTVLITGCSSGYGLATARHFHAQGWNVIATMRTPREDVLPQSDRLHVVALDVTKSESIAVMLGACGPIDVLVNNAGIGVVGAFEVTPMSTVREVFETNSVRDQHVRSDGDDTGGAAPVSRAEVGRGGERDLKCDAGADAVGGCVHREQGSYRRVHRVARVRAPVL